MMRRRREMKTRKESSHRGDSISIRRTLLHAHRTTKTKIVVLVGRAGLDSSPLAFTPTIFLNVPAASQALGSSRPLSFSLIFRHAPLQLYVRLPELSCLFCQWRELGLDFNAIRIQVSLPGCQILSFVAFHLHLVALLFILG